MAKRFYLPIAFLLLAALSTAAQTSTPVQRRPAAPPSNLPPATSPGRDDQEDSHMPDEMRIRMEIARADAEYKKAIDDADRLSALSGEVVRAFRDAGKLGDEELKKLGAIEKLAKRVLAQAGGDEVDDRAAALQRQPLGEAVEQIGAAADKVQKCVKQQTRFVVSAVVVSNANDIIHLVQHIRRSLKAD